MDIAGHGFETVEVFATRSHFDYHDAAAIGQLDEWLGDTGLEFHSMHAPIVEALRNGQWIGSFLNASGDEQRRKQAVQETRAALDVARRLPFKYLVLHLGVPAGSKDAQGDNQPSAARRSLEEIAGYAADVGVRVAVEVIPNPLSSASTLTRLIEEEIEGLDVGICLDYGHAHMMGDVAEAIETISGHLVTTHVHDNGGSRDDHLVPFEGSLDWSVAMMATQKVGYDGVLMFEVAATGNPVDVLKKTATARGRLEQLFVTF